MNLGAFRRRLGETDVNADKAHRFFQCERRLGRGETESSSINPLGSLSSTEISCTQKLFHKELDSDDHFDRPILFT